jgi:hypothetical protein
MCPRCTRLRPFQLVIAWWEGDLWSSPRRPAQPLATRWQSCGGLRCPLHHRELVDETVVQAALWFALFPLSYSRPC